MNRSFKKQIINIIFVVILFVITIFAVSKSTDELNFSKKGKLPIYNFEERARIVGALKVVDEVFKEESLELKAEYIKKFNASVLIMGDDWVGKFDWVKEHCDVEVIYLPRTPSVSTTAIIEKIRS